MLLLETSEELMSAREFGWILRSIGERGILRAVAAVIVARPPTSDFENRPSTQRRVELRAEQRDTASAVIGSYNPDAAIAVGVPFGHTRPQWILPYGGEITVDGVEQRIWASYD